MLWSLIKIFIFVAVAVALAFGLAWVLETPGEVIVAFAGREWSLSPVGTLIALVVLLVAALVVLKILGFLVALGRFLLGDQTAISRHFSRSRERRGYDALSDGMIALAAGDSRQAAKKAAKAERLLPRRDVTGLVQAQAAELNGDKSRAIGYYKAMLDDRRTRFLGVTGLMRQKLEAGETGTALALAKKAFALHPDNPALLRTLFDLQCRESDWAGARETLNASMHARLLPRDVAHRRDAVLSLADARAAAEAGDTARRDAAALQANKLAPTLVPAAVIAAQVLTEKAMQRKAQKVLTRAWAANPHPDLAAAFAAVVPDETPEARRKRFESLIAAAPTDTESRLLAAELAIAAEDFPAARKALGNLAEETPTTRSLALMAAVERGQGAPEAEVRGWLARAIDAPRGPQWICDKCGHMHPVWIPVCDGCGAFDTLAWTSPPHEQEVSHTSASMLPLLIDPADSASHETADDAVAMHDEEAPPRAASA
jgi:HemY protein